MSLMKWTREDYGTNVEVCDDQHRELFNRVNALNDAVSAGVRTDIGTRLDSLIDYVIEHFQSEERLMEERGYAGLDKHRLEHENLVKTCADLQGRFHANEVEIEEGTMAFIKNWLDHHIPVIDRSYGPALSN
ncbi:MAG: bacteriohemerythrin [Candidatus Thiodiazotropha sp.]